jgi:hypothetical protein
LIRNADNLVCCLPIEFEIELGLRPTIIPFAKRLQLAASQAAFRQRGPFDVDADARRLPENAGFLWDRFGGDDDASRNQTLSAFVLAREDEDRVASGDMLATVHRFLCFECQPLRLRITDLSFDRERHASLTCSVQDRCRFNLY